MRDSTSAPMTSTVSARSVAMNESAMESAYTKLLHAAGDGRKGTVRRGGADQDHVEVLRVDLGRLQRRPRGPGRQLERGRPRLGDVAGGYARGLRRRPFRR